MGDGVDSNSTLALDSDFVLRNSDLVADGDIVETLPLLSPELALGGEGGDVSTAKRNLKSDSKGRNEKESPLCWEIWENENEKAIDAIESLRNVVEDDTVVVKESSVDTVNPSSDILLPLLRFQKEWLFWALKQEDSEYRGGLLADDMGMGKTIQAISLVLTAREQRLQCGSGENLRAEVPCCSSSGSLPRAKCTLVICPVVAVTHWVGEIERHTKKGSASVLVYHGAKRGKIKYEFNNYDFVVTTYSTIGYEYRKSIMPPKERCQWCDKRFYPDKMTVHLKYYCGPDAQKTKEQSNRLSRKRKNIRVSEDEGFNDQTQSLRPFHGHQNKWNGRVDDQKNGSVSRDLDSASSEHSVLHYVKWERIILDEAHFIKDRRSNTAKAIFALESSYKWALSGTPLQNRVGELYSLVRFLQIYPYSYYLCKDCDCKILDYSKNCMDCTHSAVRHFCWWNKYITTPIQLSTMSYDGRRAMILLKDIVLKSIILRRTKEGRAADLALPPRIVNLRHDCLDRNEEEFYQALFTKSRVQFATYADAGTLMNNYAYIFDMLTRLRQAVDHPYLVVYSPTVEVYANDTERKECVLCHETLEDMVITSCQHAFCKACLISYTASLGNVICPLCSKPLIVDLTSKTPEKISAPTKGKKSGILSRINTEAFQTSTKIDAVKEEIRDMIEVDGSAKGIVFSQFTSFLDLIHFSLEKSGIKCVQLVGSMSLVEREKAIKAFNEDAECRIFLMSLKAGGVALNLTVASHVFLMDPWWNPAVERQARDRIYRIGQYKPIRITRFVIENTVEERILKLQEKKELVFKGTIENSSEAMAKLTEDDLRFLFHV